MATSGHLAYTFCNPDGPCTLHLRNISYGSYSSKKAHMTDGQAKYRACCDRDVTHVTLDLEVKNHWKENMTVDAL